MDQEEKKFYIFRGPKFNAVLFIFSFSLCKIQTFKENKDQIQTFFPQKKYRSEPKSGKLIECKGALQTYNSSMFFHNNKVPMHGH